jgi:hypothetical protein
MIASGLTKKMRISLGFEQAPAKKAKAGKAKASAKTEAKKKKKA